MHYNLDDTIAAISTPVGEGGIGIVRLSGKEALSIADRIFRSKDGKIPSQFNTYTLHYGYVVRCVHNTVSCLGDRNHKGYRKDNSNYEIVDEALLTVMRAPKSYTKEDVVEINCHSGIVALRRVLELVLLEGARLAQPGEFTKRAFLNGRIDLAQAESVLDIIKSKTETSLRAAMSQLEGVFSGKVREVRCELIDVYSHIEASIDFPEEDSRIFSDCNFATRIQTVMDRIKNLINSADKGIVLMEGIRTVICGRPNVGKSSLMNSLLGKERVIVSHLPGTTRDIIEEIINIEGIPLRIVDTAGIVETDDILTKEGVSRSRFYLNSSDLIIFVMDASQSLEIEDEVLINELKDKKVIVAVNKIDLPKSLQIEKICSIFGKEKVIEISATKRINLEKLKKAISGLVWSGEVTTDYTGLVTNARHKALLLSANSVLERAFSNFKKGMSSEFISLDIKEAIEYLGEITGETIDIDILEKIFSKFCIGK